MNKGLILEPPKGTSPLLGASLPVRRPNGDWEQFLPAFEPQFKFGLETMNCVQFSFLNVIETIAKSYGRELNLSDRFLYWASGCTDKGNTYTNCLTGYQMRKCCSEERWPWLAPVTREEYGIEPPEAVRDEAKLLSKDWTLGDLAWVPLDLDSMRGALQLSPLWFCNSSHSMMIYRIDDRIRVFDTYGDGHGSFPLDYVQHIEACYNLPFTPTENMPLPPNFTENMMYQLVEGIGGFLLFAKGRMYKDDAAKILASFVVRNGGDINGKTGTLRLKDLEGVPLFNLKDEPVTL